MTGNHGWIVTIKSDIVDKSLYKVINEGSEIVTSPEVKASSLATWNAMFELKGGPNTKYTSTFSVTANRVTLNYRQYPADGDGDYVTVIYSIVKKGLLWDTSYASSTVDGSNEDYADQIILSCGNRTGVCLKIKCTGFAGMGVTYSWGEVYNQ